MGTKRGGRLRLLTATMAPERPFRSVVILTGAGISAESGLGTFRDKDGLWTKYDLSEVATPEGRAFLEESVFYGFDYMLQVPAGERQQRINGDLSNVFLVTCPR